MSFLVNRQIITSFALALTLVAIVVCYPLPPPTATPDHGKASIQKETATSPRSHASRWQGWESIKHMVVFRDSISTTGFNVDQRQPSRTNPLGNPDFPGLTSANGTNWVGYLTATYNTSFLKTVNLASGGATVDTDLISGMSPAVKSFKDQTEQWWLPYYVPATAQFD